LATRWVNSDPLHANQWPRSLGSTAGPELKRGKFNLQNGLSVVADEGFIALAQQPREGGSQHFLLLIARRPEVPSGRTHAAHIHTALIWFIFTKDLGMVSD
jgi:hypothetical protein